MRPCRETETNREDERILLKNLFPTESFGRARTSKLEQMACEETATPYAIALVSEGVCR